MDVRSALFGSTVRIALTAVLGVGILTGGAVALGVLGVPGVAGVENAFGGVNATTTVIETDLAVTNPNPIGVSLGSLAVDYRVEMNDIRMASGYKEGLAVGTGNSTVNFTTQMRNEKIPTWWVSHITRGERTELAVHATLRSGLLGRNHSFTPAARTIETDIIGQFNSTEDRPINAGAPAVEDPVAWINVTNATWGDVSRERTPIRVEFVVYNPKSYPLTVTELGYDVRMNDVKMGQGRTDRNYVVPPGSTETVATTLVLDNEKLDEWWVTHLEADQTTRLRIDFSARIDAGATTVQVPLRGMTYEKTVETDFFGNKPADGNGSAAEGGGGGDDGAAENTTTTTTTADENTTTTTTTAADDTTDGTTTDGNTTDGNGSDDDGGLLAVDPRTG